jgi:hypothetical protein
LEIGEWWTVFQEVNENARNKMLNELPTKSPRKRRKRKPG